MKDFIYIEDEHALASMCMELCECDWLAIDTEFVRERTYFSKLALVQIANSEQTYCVDPLALDDLSPLLGLLENPAIIKVFHAAAQDLETFFHESKCIPQPIFDTQVAAAMLGLGEQIGYASLVRKVLNVELEKSQTRTDWLKRPLQNAQLRYAADDVRYLCSLYLLLKEKLARLGRLEWLRNDLDRLQDPANYRSVPLECWQRVKGWGKLKKKPLNILKHLAAWRERQAIRIDIPRRWILSDDVILNLAMLQPGNRKQLNNVRMLDDRDAKRYGATLLDLIAQAQDEPEENWPTVERRKKPSIQEEATLDALMAVVRLCADKHQLAPGQIASRSDLLRLLRGEQDLALLSGWRFQIAGQAIMDTYQGKLQMICKQGSVVLQSC